MLLSPSSTEGGTSHQRHKTESARWRCAHLPRCRLAPELLSDVGCLLFPAGEVGQVLVTGIFFFSSFLCFFNSCNLSSKQCIAVTRPSAPRRSFEPSQDCKIGSVSSGGRYVPESLSMMSSSLSDSEKSRSSAARLMFRNRARRWSFSRGTKSYETVSVMHTVSVK